MCNLLRLSEKEMKAIAKSTKGLAFKGLKSLANLVKKSFRDEDAPEVEYYLDHENPFAKRYGTEKDEWGVERWVTFLKSTTAFSGVVVITDLVQYIALASKRFFEGTKRKNDFFFHHDALDQLLHADTVVWMKCTIVPSTSRLI